jgi:predicted MFS family arabinose efflux permease
MLGILSIAPVIGLLVLAFIVPILMESEQYRVFLPTDDILRLALAAVGLIITLGCIVYTKVSDKVPHNKHALWIVVLIFVNLFAIPFFWYWYIFNPRRAQ